MLVNEDLSFSVQLDDCHENGGSTKPTTHYWEICFVDVIDNLLELAVTFWPVFLFCSWPAKFVNEYYFVNVCELAARASLLLFNMIVHLCYNNKQQSPPHSTMMEKE